MNRLTRIAAGIALATCATVSTSAFADLSYNVGWASDYYFRGGGSLDSSSASAGADYEESGFYAGAWTADVGDGLEVDGYFGYGMDFDSGVSASVGFTGYYYTGDADDTYEEINLGLGFGYVSAEYSFGEYDNFGGPTQDYDFFAVTLENNGFYGTWGTWGDEFDGDYFELGYGFSVAEIDFGVAAIFNDKELNFSGVNAGIDSDETVVFTIGKSF
jgi:uncharacterized protein (TIGR02001 family)